MSERGKGKGVVEVVLEKKKKDGNPFWVIVIDGKEYNDYKGSFKDKKGQEMEFEWADSDDGKITFINLVGGGGGARSSGGFSRAKSPEEMMLQKKAFALSYAKDQINMLLKAFAPLVGELPGGMKYLEFLPLMREAASKMTRQTADDFLAKLNES